MRVSIAILAVCLLGCGSNGPDAGATSSDPNPPSKASLLIDHKNSTACDKAPAATMEKVAKMNVFFAHASVGQNIVEGLNQLHRSDGARFALATQGAGERPEGASQPGMIYEFQRGNPGASAKISSFAQYVGNGWNASNVKVVLNKFCYIDQDANYDEYVNSMEALESQNQGLTVVYATIPLCSEDPGNNVKREQFNQRLRELAKTKKKALLDIADIEAHDASGKAFTFQEAGQTYFKMNPAYTSDGGHLNATGSVAVAKGLYSLLVALAK